MTNSSNRADRRAALLRVVVGRPGPSAPTRPRGRSGRRWRGSSGWFPCCTSWSTPFRPTSSTTQREEIAHLQQDALARCVQLEHNLLDVSRSLATHGIRSVALKGVATAHLDYPDPSWREFSDADLLIDPADRIGATAVLASEGWAQAYALAPDHERYTHAVTFARDRMELDLHQRIGRRALGVLVPTHELLHDAVPFEIAGARAAARSPRSIG